MGRPAAARDSGAASCIIELRDVLSFQSPAYLSIENDPRGHGAELRSVGRPVYVPGRRSGAVMMAMETTTPTACARKSRTASRETESLHASYSDHQAARRGDGMGGTLPPVSEWGNSNPHSINPERNAAYIGKRYRHRLARFLPYLYQINSNPKLNDMKRKVISCRAIIPADRRGTLRRASPSARLSKERRSRPFRPMSTATSADASTPASASA